MKIGELAERLGTTVRTLRFYEEQGLVEPGRSSGGTRRYTEQDLQRYAIILTLARLGVPLAALGRLAATRPNSRSGDEASRRVDAQLATLAAELAEQRRRIERVEQDLARARERLPHCFGCAVRPTHANCAGCEVGAGLLQTDVMQLVWDTT